MDRSVRLWHADTSLCLRRFLHPDMVTCVAFHPVDENFVVTAGCDGVARVWRPADHACVAQLDVGAVATAIEFSPDGTCAFVGTYDARIVTLDLKDIITDGKSALASHPNSSSPLQSKVSLSPMTSSNDNLNSAPLLKMRHSIDIHHRRKRKRSRGPKVGGLCADTRSNRIYSISSDARIHVLNDDGNVHARFRAPARKESSRKEGSVLLSPTISPDGKYILHDAVGGVVRLIKLPVARKADAKRRERETSIGVEHVIALETANVSCAAFASFAVLENARPGRDNRRRFIMAVGGDDGSVSIIENAYR